MSALILAILLGTSLESYDATVIGCYDGDTCRVNIYPGLGLVSLDQPVRLCDIDAPELRIITSRTEALQARDALIAWVNAAKRVQIQIPQKVRCTPSQGRVCDKQGKYGRWLVYLIADGVNLNQRLLDEGLAQPYAQKCVTGD